MKERAKSPTTGKDVFDFLRDALASMQMEDSRIAWRLKTGKESIARWRAGISAPQMKTLERLSRASGVRLEAYLPEAVRGKILLQNAEAWPRGLGWYEMDQQGVGLTRERFAKARRGINAGDGAEADMLVKLCAYYDAWSDRQASRGAVCAQQSPKVRRRPTPRPANAAEEEKMARDLCTRTVFCGDSAQAFKLRRLRKRLWQCESERYYRCEIDLERMELRVYFKPKNALSFIREI